jgi:O-antigen/teichoic acid export membrane protein
MVPSVPISKKILLVNSAGTVVRRLLSISVLFWMHQYLIRRIPAEECVLLPVLMAVMAFTPLLTTILSGGLGRYVTEAYAQGDTRRVTGITSTMAPLMILAASMLTGLGALFAWKIDVMLEIAPTQVENARLMFFILIVGAAIRVASSPFTLGYYIRQRFVRRDLIGVGFELLRIGLLLYLLTQHETRVMWVVVASFIAGFGETVVVFVGSRRLVPELRFELARVRRSIVRPLVSYGGWTILGQSSSILREMAGPLILNHMATDTDVVAFNLGAQVDRHVRLTVVGATAVAQPATTAMAATGNDERLRRTWLRLNRYSMWALFAIGCPLILFRSEFFQLYLRERYVENQEAELVLALLMARLIVLFPNSATSLLSIARAEVRSGATRSMILELVNLALTVTLVGAFKMGALGSALGTFAAAMVGHPILVWTFGLRLSGARFGEWLKTSILPGLLPVLVAGPAWYAAHRFMRPDTWAELAIAGLLGGVVYAGVLLARLGPDDRDDLRSALARIGVGRLKNR